MIESIANALRIVSHFWLEEVQPNDLMLITTLPELAETIPQPGTAELTALSVEYQRLFGFNLPPYESVFIDPSAMLMAPATERVQILYQDTGWTPPAGARAGAPDHLGLELLALADWLDQGSTEVADKLQTRHLALWAPVFILTLPRLDPHPFYTRLAELTLDLLLTLLPANPVPPDLDPFPDLPPPPKFRGTEESWPQFESAVLEPDSLPSSDGTDEIKTGLRGLIKRLLRPREAGLFLTRDDIARLGLALDLPGAMGDRYRMLETLFRSARQYDQLPSLSHQLNQIFAKAFSTYTSLASEHPVWSAYAKAWQKRLTATQTVVTELIIDSSL
jgi:TorA maturation chaperone TorD